MAVVVSVAGQPDCELCPRRVFLLFSQHSVGLGMIPDHQHDPQCSSNKCLDRSPQPPLLKFTTMQMGGVPILGEI